jgi:hypothetical protein
MSVPQSPILTSFRENKRILLQENILVGDRGMEKYSTLILEDLAYIITSI